jgi:flagellar basal-body rod protein FlgF
MSRDIYASLSGAAGAWTQIEMLAHNLANTNTTGFKQSRLTFELGGPSEHPLGQVYAEQRGESVDLTDGALMPDGVSTHLALQGRGFFVVEDGNSGKPGSVLLTRDGRFRMGPDGTLVDGTGRRLLGVDGPIRVPEEETLTILQDGTVQGSISGDIGRLRIETGQNVSPIGDNYFVSEGMLVPAGAQVIQGSLEQSNVDPMRLMTELVAASRMFEAYQKAMQASDELDARLNQIGG